MHFIIERQGCVRRARGLRAPGQTSLYLTFSVCSAENLGVQFCFNSVVFAMEFWSFFQVSLIGDDGTNKQVKLFFFGGVKQRGTFLFVLNIKFVGCFHGNTHSGIF